jgi:hypothetical protein
VTDAQVPDHVDARVLSTPQLIGALRAGARGSPPREAAVGLLIEHRRWLTHGGFLRNVAVRPAAAAASRGLMAVPDWDALCELTEQQDLQHAHAAVLTVAVELASALDTGWRFQELVAGLDRADTVLVLRAILHARLGHEAGPVEIGPFPV